MLKRTLTALLLIVLATTAAATAQTTNPVVRAGATLTIQRVSPNPSVSNQALYYAHLGVVAALQWLNEHDYLWNIDVDPPIYHIGNTWVAAASVGGLDFAIVLGPGSVVPAQGQSSVEVPMTAVISNGF